MNVSFNDASGGATALNWATGIDLDDTGTTFVADPVTVLGTTIGFTGATKNVSGSLTGVNIADVFTGSAGFDITKEAVTVDADGDTGIAAELLSVLSSLDLRIGTTDYYASVNGGTLNVYSVAPAVADARSWLAVNASSLGGTLHLGTLASATLTDVLVKINSGTGSDALNWGTTCTARPSPCRRSRRASSR